MESVREFTVVPNANTCRKLDGVSNKEKCLILSNGGYERPFVPHDTLIINKGTVWGCGMVYGSELNDTLKNIIMFDGGGYTKDGQATPGKNQVEYPVEIPGYFDGEIPARIFYSISRHYVMTNAGNIYETGYSIFHEEQWFPDCSRHCKSLVFNSLLEFPEKRQVRDFSCGSAHSAVMCDDHGEVWLLSEYSRITKHYPEMGKNFTRIQGAQNIQMVSCGFGHVLMLDSLGSVYSFGPGSIALGRRDNLLTIGKVNGITQYVAIISIKASYGVSYFLDDHGEMYACGRVPLSIGDDDEYDRYDFCVHNQTILWPTDSVLCPLRNIRTGFLEAEEIHEFEGTLLIRKTDGNWWSAGFDLLLDPQNDDDYYLEEDIRELVGPKLINGVSGCKLVFQGINHAWFSDDKGQILVYGVAQGNGLDIHKDIFRKQTRAEILPDFVYNPLRGPILKNPNKRKPLPCSQRNTQRRKTEK